MEILNKESYFTPCLAFKYLHVPIASLSGWHLVLDWLIDLLWVVIRWSAYNICGFYATIFLCLPHLAASDDLFSMYRTTQSLFPVLYRR